MNDDNSFIAEALPVFISEAREQTAMLEQLLLQLEDAPTDRELLDALFRCAHTVKGSAGIFGLDAVVGFTHHVETLLDRLREGALALTPPLGTLLLQCNDQIRMLIDAAEHPAAESGDAADDRLALVARLQAAGDDRPHAATAPAASTADATTEAKAPTSTRHFHVEVAFGSETFRNGMDPLAILNYLRAMGAMSNLRCDTSAVPSIDMLDPEACRLAFGFDLATASALADVEAAFSFVRDDCVLSIVEHAVSETADADTRPGASADTSPATPRAAAAGAQGSTAMPKPAAAARPREAASAPAPDDNRYIRVQADRLDAVINLLGELVIASAGASLLARESRQGSLVEANQQITSLVEEIRNGTLQLRMVPIGETFSRFRRVVRDTASALGKDVLLEIQGGDTELDKSVVERIADPMMHLVRNALDHGLETPAEREAAGKPGQGRLTMSARHVAGSILITIVDDGRGIQRDKVLQRAWERGLVEPGVTPDDASVLNLIFEPGFSTAAQVTNLSGRGVGMDVVRRNIEMLRGSVTLHSEPGQGSRVELRLPLTLAIIDGFLIGVGPSKFIFPLDGVVEVIESRPTANATTLDARGRGLVELRGRMLPMVSLRQLYALDSPAPQRCSIVVIQSGTRCFGVMVDVLLGQHQTVIKPLSRMFRSLRGISGSTILGSGEVALIFDVSSLSELACQPSGPSLSNIARTQRLGEPS